MTISTTTSVVTYQGNGSALNFTFPFVADSASDIQVLLTIGEFSTVLSPSVYTLVINAPPTGGLWGIGGTVTYPITGSPLVPIPIGTLITIQRIVPYTQVVSINNQGAFYPQVLEQAMDVLELQIQQIETQQEYSLNFPLEDITPPNPLPPAAARENGFLAFNSIGQPYIAFTSPVPSVVQTRQVITTGTATIGVLPSDAFGGVSIYQSATPVTSVQLSTAYGPFPIFDGGLNASTYPIQILPPPGLTILGKSSAYLNFNGQSLTFFNDGFQILIG